jgi:hypothetical protein
MGKRDEKTLKAGERRTAIGKRCLASGTLARSRRVNVTHPPRATNLPGRRRVRGQHAETADRLRSVIASEARVCVHLILIIAALFACALLGCYHRHTALPLHVSHQPKASTATCFQSDISDIINNADQLEASRQLCMTLPRMISRANRFHANPALWGVNLPCTHPHTPILAHPPPLGTRSCYLRRRGLGEMVVQTADRHASGKDVCRYCPVPVHLHRQNEHSPNSNSTSASQLTRHLTSIRTQASQAQRFHFPDLRSAIRRRDQQRNATVATPE